MHPDSKKSGLSCPAEMINEKKVLSMHNKHSAFISACTPEGAMPLSHPGCEALLCGTFGSTFSLQLAEGGIFADKPITQLRTDLAKLDQETYPQPLVERFQPIDTFRIAQKIRDDQA